VVARLGQSSGLTADGDYDAPAASGGEARTPAPPLASGSSG